MTTQQYDYLLVGQGLAGSLLAWTLIEKGCRVAVIDNQCENASQIAAGLINPVTGMRLVKQDNIERLLAEAKTYYKTFEQLFNHPVYIEKSLLRVVKNEKEYLKYQQRLLMPDYSRFLYSELHRGMKAVCAPLGLIEQKQTGYVLTRPLLASLRDFFQKLGCYYAEPLHYAEMLINSSGVSWHSMTAKAVIFCEGAKAIDNPWFGHLPFQLAKGEILTLASDHVLPTEIINYGHWFIPIDNQQFRIGASFEHHDLNTQCTKAARESLLNAGGQVLAFIKDVTVIAQHANIRPTTLDKMPFIGRHPVYSNLYIFNGFGAKGSVQIPYYCQQLADFLLQAKPIAPTVECSRYAFTVP